ncbi:hypothetical protein K504DRAFT_505438 [Pleomassaria siparia CBS 279.74]|uniref:RING-type domain-containing protein n=1 Tax=Pleomassaria siparia CBS 279.74 TaxID=1314801 RepID=A0A6G1K214_9PLEO|nr:hypothetical protein K504DRAFT_505438 [Pleomassaria siparia CBS 279.74]
MADGLIPFVPPSHVQCPTCSRTPPERDSSSPLRNGDSNNDQDIMPTSGPPEIRNPPQFVRFPEGHEQEELFTLRSCPHGHFFCKVCISLWFHVGQKTTCPSCPAVMHTNPEAYVEFLMSENPTREERLNFADVVEVRGECPELAAIIRSDPLGDVATDFFRGLWTKFAEK